MVKHPSSSEPYQSRTLFECKNGVTLHTIPNPANTTSLSEITFSKSNQIWRGSLEFIEQEQQVNSYMEGFEQSKSKIKHNSKNNKTDDDNFIIHPFIKMRSKLEFKNSATNDLWAESWYNPMVSDLNLSNSTTNGPEIDIRRITKISPDGEDTIQQISDDSFKVIVQLPNTGFHPYFSPNESRNIQESGSNNNNISYVALGLKFKNGKAATQFEYIMDVYLSRFRHEQQQYYYDRMVYAVNIINFKTIMQEQDEEDEEDDINDIRELTHEFANARLANEPDINVKVVEKNGLSDTNAADDDGDDDGDDDDHDDGDDDFGEFIST